jgi:hypothetical protein
MSEADSRTVRSIVLWRAYPSSACVHVHSTAVFVLSSHSSSCRVHSAHPANCCRYCHTIVHHLRGLSFVHYGKLVTPLIIATHQNTVEINLYLRIVKQPLRLNSN